MYKELLINESEDEMQYTLASRSNRFLARLIDTALIALIFALAPLLMLVFADEKMFEPVLFIGLPILFLLQALMLCLFGQTIGKKIVKIKIVKLHTLKNGGFVPNVLLRVILNWIFCIIPVYGLVDSLFILNEDRRCLHDKISGTIVTDV